MAKHSINPPRKGAPPRRSRRLAAINTYERGLSGVALRDGDYVELANKWAKVVITAEVDIEGDGAEHRGCPRFIVSGDTMPQAKQDPQFDTMGEAIGYCFVCLTYYAEGRLD